MTAPASTSEDPELPPHDIQAEQITVGAAMMDPAALMQISQIITPMDLYRPAHQIIFETVLEMHDNRQPLGAVAVGAELAKRGRLSTVGGGPYLHTLVNTVPTAVNGGYYASIVADKARLRALVAAGTRIAQLGYAGIGEVVDVQEQATTALTQAMSTGVAQSQDTYMVGDDEEFFDQLASPDDDAGLVTFPYADLREAIADLKGGELVTVAGRTSMGKSVMAMDTARHVAIGLGLPTLLVSLEMPRELLLRRIYAAEAKVPSTALARKELTDAHWHALSQARVRVSQAPLWLSTPTQATLGVIRARLDAMARAGAAPGLLIVDHVGLMATHGRVENRQTEVSAYSRGLKLLAMEYDIPVLMVAQLNRAVESREDRIPRISDLRDSGSLENDSDAVVLVVRPDYYDAEARAGEVDLIIAKSRSGATKTVTVAHQLHYQRFVDMAHG